MSAAPRSIAFFDLDHTLVDGDSDTSFIEYLHRRGEVARDVIDDKEPIHAAYLEGRPGQADYERLLARIYGG
ncbi:MAG: haloacid dehalogenase-like hydrolase, partial [Planctomycetota bacterium]|nr:haloacid dehalogenase-like hydrolase [Planctomycetota bacterium]